jgi:2-polyprenyl-6-methoxyphenol hydroxylase-like FAD-dependent oxidoreductase
MAPDLGQGANAAMVDALVLLRLLAPALHDGGDVAVVGPAYQSVRRRFVSDTQALAGQVGWLSSPGRHARHAPTETPYSASVRASLSSVSTRAD